MKKAKFIIILSIIVAAVISVSLYFMLRPAEIRYSTDVGVADVVGLTVGKYGDTLDIPGEVVIGGDILKVNKIGLYAFYENDRVESLKIGEGVKIIEHGAFGKCANLKNISLPSSLETIYGYAFTKCESLEKVVIPYGTVTVSTGAFSECTSLKDVYIPASVMEIGQYAFHLFTNEAYVPIENLVIHCVKNSAAHTYAVDNGINFVFDV